MNISPEELKREMDYLKKTLLVIKELIEKDDNSIKDRMTDIQEMKKYLWENSGILDDVEIATGMYGVNCDVSYTNENIKKLMKLKKSLDNPYFGRIDFDCDGFSEPIYIGINGVAKDLNFYVFDWRTPIASLFYNYGTGPAFYDAPRGKISGNITLKRQYKISGENIERCFNSDLNIDDEYLQEILANASSEKMTNIVNTIQREQNEIIRNVSDKFLIVQGIAGSGKTSVALHRIAYLLYKEKDLKSNNVLIFSPNDVFSQYISNVLPELGEDNVLQTTFSDFARAYIRDFKEIESFTEFIERYYKNETISSEEYKITQYKVSNDFKVMLDETVEKFKNELSFIRPIVINGKVTPVSELNRLLKVNYERLPLIERIDRIVEYVCERNNISFKKYGKTIKEKIKTIINSDLDIKKIYMSIINSDEFAKRAKIDRSIEVKFGKQLKYDDLLPLMYLMFEINGYPKNNSIRHVIIDEAQDYSLLQFSILRKIFNTASFTVLGDIHQTINPYYIYNNLNEVNSIFDNKGKYIELNKTYRSSQEIIEFTNQILGLENACSVRKNNTMPVTLRSVPKEQAINQILQDIEEMKKNGIKRIAIITKNNAETLELYDNLRDQLEDINIIEQSAKNGIGNMVILPSYISKGLEFDGVIAYTEENHEYQEKDKYLFYVVCTRAQHNLTVYNQNTLKLVRKK